MKISEIGRGALPFRVAAISYLSKMPDDEVITIDELSERIGHPVPQSGGPYRAIAPYGCKVMLNRRKFVYGNPKAIRALKKKLNSL